MDGCINIILYQTLAQKNSILVVVTFPGHESDQRVLAECQLTVCGGRTVCDHFANLHAVALKHDRLLVVAVGLVTSGELGQVVFDLLAVICRHTDQIGAYIVDGTGLLCNNADTGVNGCLYFDTGSDYRSLGCQKRHCLTLHVGSHECTVCIVVLQERNGCGSDGKHHLRGDVHVIKHGLLIFLCLIQITTGYGITDEMSFLIQRLIRLCYMVVILFVCGHVDNFVCDTRILRIGFIDLTVRSLNKSVLVDSCIACQRVDQTDVRSLRRLDRAHSSIVGVMYISHLESCTVSGQTARSQCGKTSLVCQL